MNSTWDSEDWLSSARAVTSWVNRRPETERVMMFIRHSHRESITDHMAQLSTELTDLGKDMSFEMGKRLPPERAMHLFFSFVQRCYQTAEGIAKGFSEIGGTVIDMDPLPILVTPEIIDDDVWENLQPDGENITEYVNRWVEGDFKGMIEGFTHYQERLLDDTVRRLHGTKKPVMHIHVTHDLGLMAMKRILMDRTLVYDDREHFQGGIGLALDEKGKMTLFVSGEEMNISIE